MIAENENRIDENKSEATYDTFHSKSQCVHIIFDNETPADMINGCSVIDKYKDPAI